MLRLVLVLMCALPTQTYLSGETSYRYLPDSTIRVTAVELEPYLVENPDYVYHVGQPKYIGYIPDLIEGISKLTGLDYVISKAQDNSFGYKRGDGTWDGMIGELVRQEVEVAAGPMYQTSQRARAVDFTIPFINVEATLLLRKPPPGSTLHIRSISDLINQSEIQYGTLDRGVIIRAFKNTNNTALKIMWRKMFNFKPTVFTDSNEEGITRVRTEKYGFVIPHTIGEYMSMQEPCDLITVDRFLMKRGYSLAVDKGSSDLLEKLNLGIRTMHDSGKLNDLYRKWWTRRSQCNGSKTSKIYGGPHLGNSGHAPSGEPLYLMVSFGLLWMICLRHTTLPFIS